MFEKIPFIENHSIINIKPLNKGWSKDKKYILESKNGQRYLLRISDASLYEKKKSQFELLQKIKALDILCSEPIEFGVLENGDVYLILSYLEGEDGEVAISKMTDLEAYHLGVEAGKVLKKLHQVPIHLPQETWWEKYLQKKDKKIEALMNCGLRIPMQEEIIAYYNAHYSLMKTRPMQFAHGDFHLGNMIVKEGKIGIIDFDKNGIADPYDEFKPFCWNVMRSEYFETGLINGYFDNEIPDDFFEILKFYTAESLISQLPWSISFGSQEIETARKVANLQMQWYDHFKLDIPTWYKGILEGQ